MKDGDQIHLLENEYGYTVRTTGSKTVGEMKSTLKRRNTDEEVIGKKQKIAIDNDDEKEDESRLTWIQQQLNALQSSAQQSSSTTTNSSPIKESHPASEDHWEKPADGLEVFTSKGVISREKVCFLSSHLSFSMHSIFR